MGSPKAIQLTEADLDPELCAPSLRMWEPTLVLGVIVVGDWAGILRPPKIPVQASKRMLVTYLVRKDRRHILGMNHGALQ